MYSLVMRTHLCCVFVYALLAFRSKSRTPVKIPQVTDDESPRQGKRSRASRRNGVSGRSATEDDSASAWDDDDDDETLFGSVDDGDTTTETDWSTSRKPGTSRSTTRKTHYSSSINSRVSSIPTPRSVPSSRSTVNTRQSKNKNRPPSESSFVMSRRNSYSDPSGRETRNRSRTSGNSSTVSNRNNSRWSKHSDGGYSISSRRGASRKAWDKEEPPTPGKTSRGKISRQNTQNKFKPRSRLQSRDSNRSIGKNRSSESRSKTDSKRREPLSRRNSQIEEPTKRKRVPKKRPVLKRSDTRGSSISRASTRSRGGRKQAWAGRGQGPRANTRPALSRNESFASVSSVASVYSKQQKKMMENIYKMAFDAGVARGKSESRMSERKRSKSRSRRSSVTSYTSEEDDDYPSAPASRRTSRRNSDADSVHLSSVRDSEGKWILVATLLSKTCTYTWNFFIFS